MIKTIMSSGTGENMRTVLLVGTDHNFQCASSGPYAEAASQFRVEVSRLCVAYYAVAIAEEMSPHGLHRFDATESVAQQVAGTLGLLHQFSDPNDAERRTLGIQHDNDVIVSHLLDEWTDEQIAADILLRGSEAGYRIREQFWLERIHELDAWPLLFICGATHFYPFRQLLIKNHHSVIAAHPDWEPTISADTVQQLSHPKK